MITYDLGNYTHTVGKIGRLAVQNLLPVYPGDSLSYSANFMLQMKPFVRGIQIDAVIDIVTTFVPMRHIYGQNWIDFITEGRDTSVILPSRSVTHVPSYLPWGRSQITGIPAWKADGYYRNWSRLFRPPNQGVDEILTIPNDHSDAQMRVFGQPCAHLEAIWNGGVDTQPTAAQQEVDASGNSVNLVELDEAAGELKAALQRDWNGAYYTDVLRSFWRGRAGTDADERPTVLNHQRINTDGVNVYGTGSNNLAEMAGRGQAIFNHGFPRRFFGEHGHVWTFVLVRFPAIHEREVHYLAKIGSPSYDEIAMEPDLVMRKAPVRHEVQDFFEGNGTQELFFQPYGQWYRYQPNIIHNQISYLNAYPYMKDVPSNKRDVALVRSQEYDDIFLAASQFHFDSQADFIVECDRMIGSTMSGAFVGAR